MPSRSIIVVGRVQGVFFRDQMKAKSDALGIKGWVKNCEDGSVEIHAEGSDDALKTLEGWCHQGPPKAKVTCVKVENANEEGCEGFVIIW